MSKKAYIGVNGIARNVSNIYVGVNGVARKVVKGYVGVNGVAQQFWGGSSPTISGSWDYWSATKWVNLIDFENTSSHNHYYVSKNKEALAYYAVIICDNSRYYRVIMISPDQNAVRFTFITSNTSLGSITDVNGIRWYYSCSSERADRGGYTITPSDCILNPNGSYSGNTIQQIAESAATDLLAKVYATPFQTSYQVGTTYNLNATDIRKTLRKCISTALHRHISKYSSDVGYARFSDNADAIITELMNRISAKSDENGLVGIRIDIGSGYVNISVVHGTTESFGQNVNHLDNMRCNSTASAYNYNRYNFLDSSSDGSVYPDWEESVTIDSAITYTTYDGWDVQISSIPYYSGFEIDTNYGDPYYLLTNIGINL